MKETKCFSCGHDIGRHIRRGDACDDGGCECSGFVTSKAPAHITETKDTPEPWRCIFCGVETPVGDTACDACHATALAAGARPVTPEPSVTTDPWAVLRHFIEQQPRIQIADDGRTLNRDKAMASLAAQAQEIADLTAKREQLKDHIDAANAELAQVRSRLAAQAHQWFVWGFEAAQQWGPDMVEEAYAALAPTSPQTPEDRT